ncbi:MAG TPA: type IV-A pilus assembly ATPase PilB [Gammaproteobacteria bacterium]|uniref:type IV-A pilus assembly ATPase PilB n=1 Tax=Immundisolibacter sp. TaxID=1934948 RepID=UPI000E7F5C84|nr:type IV-A pilus assembly ATPase PilB [Gammaproteobacteria bacterium]MCH77727.1 type IV-A pilus assembly ATPase PilB [Gammaproteobacteria bacterium]
MATPSTRLTLTGLAKRLVNERVLDEAEASRASEAAAAEDCSLVSYLIEKAGHDSARIALCASTEFGLPVFDLEALDPELLSLHGVSEQVILKHRALPLFRRGNRLFAAVSDPTDYRALDEIKFSSGLSTEAVLVPHDQLSAMLTQVLANQAEQPLDEIDDADLDALVVQDEEADAGPGNVDVDDAPVVRYVNKLLLDAINKGASDLHFEPYEKRYRVRYRLDGILREVAAPPAGLANRLAARIKVLARLDIAERRVPQDGRIKLKVSRNRSVDLRVSTCPTLYGEKIVMRVLDGGSGLLTVDQLGFNSAQRDIFMKNLGKPYGMLLITGPTGSGKTMTLYAGLKELNQPGINISTAEDPVEIVMEGINQVNVNVKAGLTFASALRSFLRQDPDVILIGEIRDLETAEIAVKAAQTGHMVLATLHTNDAPQTITRLMNMGVPSYNVAAALNLVMAQRLARRLCNHCKKPIELPRQTLLREGFTEQELDAGLTVYDAVGCDRCTDGYKGRIGIYQVMTISDDMRALIMREASAIEIAEQATRESIADLVRAGLDKVRDGVTSLGEIRRITKE